MKYGLYIERYKAVAFCLGILYEYNKTVKNADVFASTVLVQNH
jgi:hypothetical protein